MSRFYAMHLRVYKANPDRVDAIKQAAGEEWPFEDWQSTPLTETEKGQE